MPLLWHTHTAAAVLVLPAASSVLDDASLVLIASGPAMDLRNLAALHHASASLYAVNALVVLGDAAGPLWSLGTGGGPGSGESRTRNVAGAMLLHSFDVFVYEAFILG